MMNILIDADTGIDDSIAILYALKRADVRVAGITTGCGNTSAEQAAENSLRLLQLADPPYEVPVAVGARAPLVGAWEGPVPHIHGENGIGDAQLPPARQKPVDEAAADFIVRMAREYKGELTVVSLGRLTNLAHAVEKEPQLPGMVKKLVVMGGTVHAPGNVTPVVEANLAGDPEAADRVFMAGFPLTLVGLDVTTKVRLSMQHIALLEQYCAPENRGIAAYFKEALPLYMNFNRLQNNCLGHCPLHDPLAMVVATDPSVVQIRTVKARVECQGAYCRGMVVADWREHPFDARYIDVCVDVDSARAVEELLSVFCRRE